MVVRHFFLLALFKKTPPPNKKKSPLFFPKHSRKQLEFLQCPVGPFFPNFRLYGYFFFPLSPISFLNVPMHHLDLVSLIERNTLFFWCVLQVMENGNSIERKNWFPDIEPLFKLLSYENVPPYLKVNSCD